MKTVNRRIKIGSSTARTIEKINLAFQVELENPKLTFFEVNQIVKDIMEKKCNSYSNLTTLHLIKPEQTL